MVAGAFSESLLQECAPRAIARPKENSGGLSPLPTVMMPPSEDWRI